MCSSGYFVACPLAFIGCFSGLYRAVPCGRAALFALNFIISGVIGGYILVWQILVAVCYMPLENPFTAYGKEQTLSYRAATGFPQHCLYASLRTYTQRLLLRISILSFPVRY